MHNRRFSALLMGGWLLGTLLTWFATSQSTFNVERTLQSPPAHLQAELDEVGSETSRSILSYQAAQFNRRITEAWEILQLGLAGAFAACAIFTSTRSRTTVACSLSLLLFASAKAFYLTPSMTSLAVIVEAATGSAAHAERIQYHDLQVWHRVLGVLGTTLALVVSARLVFNLHEIGSTLTTQPSSDRARHRRAKGASSAGPQVPVEQTSGVINEAGAGTSQNI